ncbi:hypothetical protein, conserved [Eimeria tenella]|uniref:Choline transporter-like protein n=1 Tax=Eimeria tenella TaxID=5802 RepID=U6KXL3_EIMTE|nr:hypothetical protein, conserved [Eimeria tenella]CDJ41678.1 hypothetical protein, conserved [Eimeria tenella]|eukprot:XP_013232428.1 hypothetical protein, conserved [Eimeria tenella]
MASDAEPKRRVTDQNWLGAFSAFLLFCLFFVVLALTEGSPSRLFKGMNYQGKTCGVDPEVRDLPYLYFPLDPRESFASIMLNDGRCVAKCPTEEDVEGGLTIPTPIRETSIDPSKTSAMTVEYLLLSPAYAATLMADAYCIPLDPSLRSQLSPALNNTFRQVQLAIGSFYSAWGTIFGYLIFAVFTSLAFSASIRLSPGLVLGSAAISSIVLSFAAGGLLIKSGFTGVLDQDKGSFYSLDYTLAMFIPMGLEQNGDIGILPLHREFVWDVRFVFFGALWWFALFWVIEAMMAFAHFVISYSATVWYFSPPEGADERDVGWFPPLVAMGLGSIHHMGSFAVGGLVMGATRPIRLLFPWAATKHLASTEDSPVVHSLRNTFRSIMSPLTYIVDRFTSSGYIEVVSTPSAIGSSFISFLIGIMVYSVSYPQQLLLAVEGPWLAALSFFCYH